MAEFDDFWKSRTWLPIEQYDRETGETVLLRDGGDRWEIGYYGVLKWARADYEATDPSDDQPMFRHSQDWRQGNPLEYEPQRFARIDNEAWKEALMED